MPVAAFNATATTIATGESVQFIDQSTNSPTSWSWNFGDGGTSTQQNPSHTYSTAGIYTVKLTTTNSAGSDEEIKNDYITVNPESTGIVSDIDDNVYKTIQIGTQTWMAENLRTTRYNNGGNIPLITEVESWVERTAPAYCWYNNDVSNKSIYGALYNWHTVNTGALCPTGWHVPTETEWIMLINHLEGTIAGGKLKEAGTIHWASPNTGATNTSGFTALPGGAIGNGGFGLIRYIGDYWSSTESTLDPTTHGYRFSLTYDYEGVYQNGIYKWIGVSVRCIKD